jgi:hypothetical protein
MPITVVTGINNLDGHRVSISEIDGRTLILDTRTPEQIKYVAEQHAILQPIAEARGKIIGEAGQLQQAMRNSTRIAERETRRRYGLTRMYR